MNNTSQNIMVRRYLTLLGAVLWLCGAAAVSTFAQSDLVQVHEDFSKDPGWEWKDNRVVAADPPTITQDFGWSATNHTAAAQNGEIGGKVWQSTTPAWYAIPLNKPLNFKDKFSFSCRIAFMPTGGAGVAYLGFFNHELQGWRVWNSMVVRLGGESSGQAAIGVDSMTGTWMGAGATEGFLHVPQDGKPHRFQFSYDPEVEQGPWPDPRLRKYVGTHRRSTEEILELARKDEPNVTKQQILDRLVEAYSEGLIYYLQRTGHESIIGTTDWNGYFWGLREDKGKRKGAMVLKLDDMRPIKVFLSKAAQDEPVSMDRFGLLNLQMYHQYLDLYFSELTVNGHKVDVSQDPAWEAVGNRVQFVEQDFQRSNFGYSETNWAGDAIGEVGGKFNRTEPIDPVYGYYADNVGKLTLDDPISFSGKLCFVKESTDAGMFIGFFNLKDYTADLSARAVHLKTATSSLGFFYAGGSGYRYLNPQFTSSKDDFASKQSLTLRPLKKRQSFKFDYDPRANRNLGRITATLDDKTVTLDLTKEQRGSGTTFDRFGVAALRAGGKHVELYFDDLTYTARRPSDYKPVFHKQEVVEVPFPPGGRKY